MQENSSKVLITFLSPFGASSYFCVNRGFSCGFASWNFLSFIYDNIFTFYFNYWFFCQAAFLLLLQSFLFLFLPETILKSFAVFEFYLLIVSLFHLMLILLENCLWKFIWFRCYLSSHWLASFLSISLASYEQKSASSD